MNKLNEIEQDIEHCKRCLDILQTSIEQIGEDLTEVKNGCKNP